MESTDDEDADAEGPMRRGTVIAIVALLTLLPIAVAVSAFVAMNRSESDPKFPPLEVGSCVDVRGPAQDVIDTQCPSGNGRVIFIGTSTLDCPATAEWYIIRDSRIACVQRVSPNESSP
jgi:hypothetical protein